MPLGGHHRLRCRDIVGSDSEEIPLLQSMGWLPLIASITPVPGAPFQHGETS